MRSVFGFAITVTAADLGLASLGFTIRLMHSMPINLPGLLITMIVLWPVIATGAALPFWITVTIAKARRLTSPIYFSLCGVCTGALAGISLPVFGWIIDLLPHVPVEDEPSSLFSIETTALLMSAGFLGGLACWRTVGSSPPRSQR